MKSSERERERERLNWSFRERERSVRLERLRGTKTLWICFWNSAVNLRPFCYCRTNFLEAETFEHIYSIKPWGRLLIFFKNCVCVPSSCVCDWDALVWVDETFMNREQIGLVLGRDRPVVHNPSFLFSFVWSFPTGGKGIKKTHTHTALRIGNAIH